MITHSFDLTKPKTDPAELSEAEIEAKIASGEVWIAARAPVPARSWTVLGILAFPDWAESLGAVAGVIGQGVTREAAEIWCPAIKAGWLSLGDFAEASRGIRFGGPCPIWGRNLSDQDLEIDVRFKACRRELGAGAPAHGPDATPAYYASGVWKKMSWYGTPVIKHPADLWIAQEVIFEVKPRLILETGTFYGGSAAYFARVLDGLGQRSLVVTIDTEDRQGRPTHPRIEYLKGSSVDPKILEMSKRFASDACGSVLVFLDSDHSYNHVAAELRAYGPLVTPGSYLVVEDTNTPGPALALADFLASPEGAAFTVDRSREKFGTGFNPGGWLRKSEGKP